MAAGRRGEISQKKGSSKEGNTGGYKKGGGKEATRIPETARGQERRAENEQPGEAQGDPGTESWSTKDSRYRSEDEICSGAQRFATVDTMRCIIHFCPVTCNHLSDVSLCNPAALPSPRLPEVLVPIGFNTAKPPPATSVPALPLVTCQLQLGLSGRLQVIARWIETRGTGVRRIPGKAAFWKNILLRGGDMRRTREGHTGRASFPCVAAARFDISLENGRTRSRVIPGDRSSYTGISFSSNQPTRCFDETVARQRRDFHFLCVRNAAPRPRTKASPSENGR